jgi:hypothetical protein
LELIGTRSAMTLLREAFYGARRFDDLVSRGAGESGGPVEHGRFGPSEGLLADAGVGSHHLLMVSFVDE